MTRRPPSSPLFPYPTLFRSRFPAFFLFFSPATRDFLQLPTVDRKFRSPRWLPAAARVAIAIAWVYFRAFTVDRDLRRAPCHYPSRSKLSCLPSSRSPQRAWFVRWARLTSHPIPLQKPRAKRARTMAPDWLCPPVFVQRCLRT